MQISSGITKWLMTPVWSAAPPRLTRQKCISATSGRHQKRVQFKPINKIACLGKKKKINNCSLRIHAFNTARKSLPSDVEGFIGLVEIAFPTVQIKYCRMIFCMSKHPSNNDQTDNVLKRETGSTFCFSSSCMDYFWIQNIQVTCWLSRKCILASSCCCGDGFYPLNAESTDKEKKYMRRTKKAGEFHYLFFFTFK